MTKHSTPLLGSKTVWFNILTLAAVIWNRYGGQVIDPATLDQLAVILATVVNTYFRAETDREIRGIIRSK